MPASYPGAVKTFTTKNTNDVIQALHVNDLQDEVNAIEAGLLNGTAPLNSSNSTVVTLSVSGGKITFPAVQSASTAANVLDDYEEGSWTPAIGGSGGQSGQAYTTQVGRYIKVGRIVHCWGTITLSTLGTVTTVAQIQGLPFTAVNISGLFPGGAVIHLFTGLTTAVVQFTAHVTGNTTTANLLHTTAAATGMTNTAQADLSDTTSISFTLTYPAAD